MAPETSPLQPASSSRYTGSAFDLPLLTPVKPPRFAGRAASTDPGNSRASALRIRPVPGFFSRANSVGSKDPDYFSLFLTQPAKLNLAFRNASRDNSIKISVLNRRGNVIKFSGQRLVRFVAPGVYRLQLEGVAPGRYFVELKTASKLARYRLSVTTQILTPPSVP